MIYKLITRSIFEIEFSEIIGYYKKLNPELAKQFINQVRIAKSFLITHPKGFELKYKNVRVIKLKKFEYLIHYVLNEPDNELFLIAITHSSRNPFDFTLR